MKKAKWMFLAIAILLSVFVTQASAAGNLSGLEQKWLDFQRELKEKQVDDGVLTKAEAESYLKDLETKLNSSGEDVVYGFFKEGDKGKKPNWNLKFVDAYAKLTNRSKDDVLKACKDAKLTVWQLANKEGNLDKLRTAVVTEASKKLNKMVSDGRITKEEMDSKLKHLQDMFERCLKGDSPNSQGS